jgi:hypothetical protein
VIDGGQHLCSPNLLSLPDRQYAYWAVYVKVAGKIDREPFLDATYGRPVEQAAAPGYSSRNRAGAGRSIS